MYELDDRQAKILADKKHWILDVDGCLYPRAEQECGLFMALDRSIAVVFNSITKQQPGKLGGILLDRTKTLVAASGKEVKELDGRFDSFLPFVTALYDVYQDKAEQHLNAIYDNDYSVIKPDYNIANAFKAASHKGVDISFYTSGPFINMQKVLAVHGVPKRDVENFRGRTYDLMDAVRVGASKPSPKSMDDFVKNYGIKDNLDNAVMFDDSIQNLKTAVDFGITPVWTWTDDKEPPREALQMAEDIGAIRVRNTGATLIKIARAR